jgi:hypothetical protein
MTMCRFEKRSWLVPGNSGFAILVFLWCMLLPATRADVLFNAEIYNGTNKSANDYHITLESDSDITVEKTLETPSTKHPGGKFTGAGLGDNGTTKVVIDYFGHTFDNGEWTHVGAEFSTSKDTEVKITNSYWTKDGTEIKSSSLGGKLPGATAVDPPSGWVVLRVDSYDGLTGPLVGSEWIEGKGSSPSDVMVRNDLDVTLYVSTSYLLSPTEIPLELLNDSLAGFSTPTPVVALPPVPEPSSLVPALAVLGIAAAARAIRNWLELTNARSTGPA